MLNIAAIMLGAGLLIGLGIAIEWLNREPWRR